MYMLVLQTFLLMMAAFLLGATFACLLKRTVNRLAGNDLPAEALHVDVPPAVPRSVNMPTPAPPVPVTREDAHRFERALHGEVAEAPAASPSIRRGGPVVEVQPLPLPPAPPPPPPAPVTTATVSVPRVEETLEPDARSYAAIAVASHDGSTLPPAGVLEAQLAAPVMPGPAAEALPVPRVAIPEAQRPSEAPDGPDRNYVEEALRAGYDYIPVAAPAVAEYQLPEATDLDHYEVPPAGESYASIAVGERKLAASEALAEQAAARVEGPSTGTPQVADMVAERVEVSDAGLETTHVSAALASAAGLAAQRAASSFDGGDDLTRIQGIDEVLASRLNYAGVTRFAQIAGWDASDVRRMSQTLGFFGRIQDEYWIDQARELAGPGARGSAASTFEPEEEYARPQATPASAADIATAAAAAAAAAMAASTAARARSLPPADAPSRPARLADAIREHSGENTSGESTAPTATEDDDDGAGGRSSMTGLRSVRSGALLGEDAQFVRGDLDDLKRIRGIGVLIEKKLNSLGITSYEQVANWSAAEVERISDVLDFKGRIERENWIEQARILASGGQTEFSRRVDRGEA